MKEGDIVNLRSGERNSSTYEHMHIKKRHPVPGNLILRRLHSLPYTLQATQSAFGKSTTVSFTRFIMLVNKIALMALIISTTC